MVKLCLTPTHQVKMANKKDKLTKAEKLGPGEFVSQKDYEEQVAFEKGEEGKPADEPAKEESPESEPEENVTGAKITEAAAFELSKDEQVAMLEKLGAEDIPRYEKDRVALILKLQ